MVAVPQPWYSQTSSTTQTKPMDDRKAVEAFAALSQATRLKVLRLLAAAGTGGLPAGVLARELGATPSNLSFHLKELEHAGLIDSTRQSRSIVYTARLEEIAGLIAYLLHDCLKGHVEVAARAGVAPLPTVAVNAGSADRNAKAE